MGVAARARPRGPRRGTRRPRGAHRAGGVHGGERQALDVLHYRGDHHGGGGRSSPAGAVVDIPRGSVEEFEAWRAGDCAKNRGGGRATAARRARGECSTGGNPNHDAHLSRPFRNPPWTAVDGVGFDRRLGRARGSTRAPLTGGSASERFSSDEPRCKAFPSPRAAHFHAAPTRGGVSPVQAYPNATRARWRRRRVGPRTRLRMSTSRPCLPPRPLPLPRRRVPKTARVAEPRRALVEANERARSRARIRGEARARGRAPPRRARRARRRERAFP